MALLSGDIKVLKAEGLAAGKAYRARLNADKACRQIAPFLPSAQEQRSIRPN